MRIRVPLLVRISVFFFELFIISFFPPALAEQILPTVTVSPPPPTLDESIAPSILLDEDDFALTYERSTAEVIQDQPGISTSKTGGFGQVGTLFVRGSGGQGTVVLDDIPLLFSVPGFFNLDTFPPEAFAGAEIERGPGAVFRSFQALGGSVRLSTKDSTHSGGALHVEGGTFGILRETAQGSLAGELGRMNATVSRGDAFDGIHFANAAHNPEREPSHFTQGIVRFSAGSDSRWLWQGSMIYRNSKADIDRFGLDENSRVALQDDTNSSAREEFWLAQSSLNFRAAERWNSRLQLGFTQLSTDVANGLLHNGVFSRLFLADWRNTFSIVDERQERRQWQIIAGGQGRQEQGQGQSPTAGISLERMLASGYVDTRFRYGAFSGEAGVRVEHLDQYGDRPLFKTAAAWQVSRELTLRASGGTGYRLPSYVELLFLFFGDPNLKPERSISGELGLEWLPMEGLNIDIKEFYYRYRDLITPAYDPHRGPIAVNIADAESIGVETDLRYAWSDHLETGISYTFNDTRDLNSGLLLPTRPVHMGRLWAQHTLTTAPVTLWAETQLRSATWNDTAQTLPLGGFVRVNAAVKYALTTHAEVYVRGENLTDNKTPQLFGTGMPGIAVYGGFKLSY